MKKYRWYAQSLKVNFNYKEWRQDLAAFVRRKLFWDFAMVSKSRAVTLKSGFYSKGNKWFEIYDPRGNWLRIIYKNQSEIVAIEPANFNKNLIDEYFKLRNIN